MGYNNEEDKEWFNQSLFFFKDNVYGTIGRIELMSSCSTADYKKYSVYNLGISVGTDKQSKFQSLGFKDCYDLVNQFKEIEKNADFIYKIPANKAEIVKRFYSKYLRLNFVISSSNERIVVITLMDNNTDFTRVVIPLDSFKCIIIMMEQFVNNYVELGNGFVNKWILSQMNVKLEEMKESLKIIPISIKEMVPSLIVENKMREMADRVNDFKLITDKVKEDVRISELKEEIKEVIPEVIIEAKEEIKEIIPEVIPEVINKDSLNRMNDFNSYAENVLDNIAIVKYDDKDLGLGEKPPVKERDEEVFDFVFINKYLNWNLYTLEARVKAVSMNVNPFNAIAEDVKETLGKNMLEGINEDEYKSICTCSTFLIKKQYREYSFNNVQIPRMIEVLGYENKLNKTDNFHRNFASELIMILAYVKTYRDKMEIRENDDFKNGAVFYSNFRLLFDSLYLTYSKDFIDESFKGLIRGKFNYCKKKGMFKVYEDILKRRDLTEVSENEILIMVDRLKGLLNKRNHVSSVHNVLYKEKLLKLPYKNDYNLEQNVNNKISIVENKEEVKEIKEEEKKIPVVISQEEPSKSIEKEDVFEFSWEDILNED